MAVGFRNTFRSGDSVPTSGQYAALHSTPHASIEKSLCIEGSRFDDCAMCPQGVLYRLEAPCAPIQPSLVEVCASISSTR